MNDELPKPPGFWATVWLLLRASRKRSVGRSKRQQELLNQRRRTSPVFDWGPFTSVLTFLFMLMINGFAAYLVTRAVESGQQIETQSGGKILVTTAFYQQVLRYEANPYGVFVNYSGEATRISERQGGKKDEIETRLRDEVEKHGLRDFITYDNSKSVAGLSTANSMPAMLGSLFFLMWGAMLVCQGEGLELDIQRRRHPMWEWLLSHPAPPAAMFLAEMLSPIAANPIYYGAPLFVGILYSQVYDVNLGVIAGLVIGIPLAIAAACLGKAIEIAAILRFSPRKRGAVIGLMGWFGYASMMLMFLGFALVPRLASVLARFSTVLLSVPWPWLGWFLGRRPGGSFSLLLGIATCEAFSIFVIVVAVGFSLWGAQRGLSGNVSAVDAAPRRGKKGAQFGREPLYRKEFLWFVRDRSAVIQVFLIPLTVAGVQLFNLRGMFAYAAGAWNYLCGVAILFGTYFLWVLGPKSLSSEGSALWLALTWPRGLESLLKAKAWLWSMISCGCVALILGYAGFAYPAEMWKIGAVGLAWFFFGRSMAEKSVTLVTVTSESGERQQVPKGWRWAAQLGMLTFAIGVFTQQWHIACMGIVYSYITAAAMWQNFRARLPYLYDPWSEVVPQAPTLMHAMIAISILVEGGTVVTGLLLAIAGRENLAVMQAIAYGGCAIAVSYGTWNFLENRGVSLQEIWMWQARPAEASDGQRKIGSTARGYVVPALGGAVAGVLLGLVANGYTAVLRHIPPTMELIRQSQEQFNQIPNLKTSYAVMAIAFAPFAEEFLFRGLLYRALDREWGGWRAIVGSAAFFAVYHPPLAWPPVFLVGLANAALFKKTRSLWPCIALHAVYNTVVILS